MDDMLDHVGGCHCGAITLTFSSRIAPAELTVRACQCRFCRKHASRTVTDPQGLIVLSLLRPEDVSRYRFGLECADYYVCKRCGVYVAAVTRDAEPRMAIAILNALDDHADFTAPATPTDHQGETRDQRQARRAAGWTPVRIETA